MKVKTKLSENLTEANEVHLLNRNGETLCGIGEHERMARKQSGDFFVPVEGYLQKYEDLPAPAAKKILQYAISKGCPGGKTACMHCRNAVSESKARKAAPALTEGFMGLKGGDTIIFKVYAGLGRGGPEYKEQKAKVNPMLVFPDHVVVNYGRFGQVVNSQNFVRKV